MIEDICFIKDITRMNCPLSNVKVWAEGEGAELKKWIGFGFSNHLFVCDKKNVTLYCDKAESDLFYDALSKRLTEELFNDLCVEYFKLIDEAERSCSGEELFSILVRLWPILTVFQEVSLYPEFVSEEDLSRLIRIRKSTESLVYGFFNRLRKEDDPVCYYYFKKNLYNEKINFDRLNIEDG